MSITPPALRPGDRVAIVCTARKVSREELVPAIAILESWGLAVVLGESVEAAYHQFGGDDALRARDLQRQLDDPAIRAVLVARGGYGTPRIIDLIDFAGFRQQPKWVAGFSDITTLNSHLLRLGYESIHGVMPFIFAQEGGAEALESLRRALFGEEISYAVAPHALNRPGTAEGELVGGNLSLLQTLSGTPSDVSTAGRILFLEDIEEYLYSVDRMLVHLDRAGKLRDLAGLVVGHFTRPQDNAIPFGLNSYEIIDQYAGKYGFPVAYGFPVGHEPHNLALICGRRARLTVDADGTRLSYPQ